MNITPNLQLILDKAEDVLGGKDKANDWIEHTSATLGDSPRNLSETAEGTIAVLLHLSAISRHSHQ